MAGILAFGAYIPAPAPAASGGRRRAQLVQSRAERPGQRRARHLQLGRGRRHHGGRGRARCLTGLDRAAVKSLRFASTTFPFLDRLNAGIVAEALNIAEGISAIDVAATQRAGTSALMTALAGGGQTLVVASEKRRTKTASPLELTTGDGAAAIVVGPGKAVATLLASASRTADFVDHYRSDDQRSTTSGRSAGSATKAT